MIRLTDDSEKEPIIQLSPMIDLVFLLLVSSLWRRCTLPRPMLSLLIFPKERPPLLSRKQ